MDIIDYGASFVSGKAPWNAVRFWVESRLRLTDEESGCTEHYCQCGSCKSEDTFAQKDLFYEDNYDFLPVFGPRHGVIFRRHACLSQDYRSCERAEDLWNGQDYHLVSRPDAQLLESNGAIRKACAEGLPLVARTSIASRDTGLRALIEYPVKTLNIHPGKNLYQVDTGPVVLPELTARYDPPSKGFSLAFVAFNRADSADFIREVPTRIQDNEGHTVTVYHYSDRLSLEAENALYALPSR